MRKSLASAGDTGGAGRGSLTDGLVSIGEWLLLLAVLALLVGLLPETLLDPESERFLFLLGAIGIWRYSMGIIHFVRGLWFAKVIFPIHRHAAERNRRPPSHIYLMVTSFRIDAMTTAKVYRSVIEEAIAAPCPATVVASLVEYADEALLRALWDHLNPPDHVALRIVRVAGSGKRDGLAYGFRAISAESPDDRAIVAVIDGDTVLRPGCVHACAPFFDLLPKVGALTTNEFVQLDSGSRWLADWHRLRFAQRHINMCSMGLSRRVLTLTGRMSVFRANVATDPGFIRDVQHDFLDHWRLGRFPFLTGDDKSTWYSLIRRGWDTYYVPDAYVDTIEHTPDPDFLRASRMLMFRWYGNSLRQNVRAARLGPQRLGFFAWYVLLDQRISMWTTLLGPVFAVAGTIKYSSVILLAYVLWVLTSRSLLTVLLLFSGHPVSPTYPLLLYYNQIVGSITKVSVLFNMDQQSWTRQRTRLDRGLDSWQQTFNRWSSRAMTFSSASLFVAAVFALI